MSASVTITSVQWQPPGLLAITGTINGQPITTYPPVGSFSPEATVLQQVRWIAGQLCAAASTYPTAASQLGLTVTASAPMVI